MPRGGFRRHGPSRGRKKYAKKTAEAPSSRDSNQKPGKTHKLTGKRTRGDWEGIALRRQPVEFVRAADYDPLETLGLHLKKDALSDPVHEVLADVNAMNLTSSCLDSLRTLPDINSPDIGDEEKKTYAEGSDALHELAEPEPENEQSGNGGEEHTEAPQGDCGIYAAHKYEEDIEGIGKIPVGELVSGDEEVDKSGDQDTEMKNGSEMNHAKTYFELDKADDVLINDRNDAEDAMESETGDIAYALGASRLPTDAESCEEFSTSSFEPDESLLFADSDQDSSGPATADNNHIHLSESESEDMMSDLDDNQIFALARMQPETWSENVMNGSDEDADDFENDDLSDCSFDDLLGELLGDGPVDLGRHARNSMLNGALTKAGKSKEKLTRRRRERLEAREVARATNFGRDPPLWQRYPEVITVYEIVDELHSFSAHHNGSEELRFPPLDSNANWYVSEISKLFGLTVTTQGSHRDKHVVANRTRRTGRLTPPGSKLHRLTSRRKNFIRTDKVTSSHNGDHETSHKEKKRGAKVFDGHVVGQHASSIDQDNFGHQLLLKMGWVQGSGLGQSQSGIVDPVVATVKLTKRGLGQQS